ncbi:hypothetical protein RclHR1_07230014 [Rhizophagus clarus]|uniref:Nuclease Le1 n=1 Tax=Rhizophagus clarus TaxID=94130 RepID=A0A2Z6SKK0_9GLOM|nr:hypothetical protein RclHR1_07230014 [Rhizophagus clarus]
MKSVLTNLLTIFLISLVSIPSPIIAWGAEGHETIGQIAQNFLQPDIASKVANLFQNQSYGGQLPLATLWADDVKRKGSPFAWSEPLHYIDTLDNPGSNCSVVLARDCPTGNCVVGAITNYTTQLDCTNGYDIFTRDFALRFLTHFRGREKGGNGVSVIFDGRQANLHAIWDTQMVNKRLADFGSDFVQYANFLTEEIRSGNYTSESNDWVSCMNLPDAVTSCPLTWAIDTNAINCPFVWATVDENPGIDLGGSYYQEAAPIIDKQLSKGGYRLGILLNSILSKNC